MARRQRARVRWQCAALGGVLVARGAQAQPAELPVAADAQGESSRARALKKPCAGDEAAQKRCARALFTAEKFHDAALAYVALWYEAKAAGGAGASKYLYNTAIALEAAGHGGWALALWREYRGEAEITESEKSEAETQIVRLEERLVALTLEITPRSALGDAARLHFTRGGDSFTVPLRVLVEAQGYRVFLDPGDWEISVEPASPSPAYNRGRDAHAGSIRLGENDRSRSLRLELVPERTTLVLTFGPSAELARGVAVRLHDPLGTEADRLIVTRESSHPLTLRRGPWEVWARPRGLETRPRSAQITLESERMELPLDWTLSPAEVQERSLRRKLRLGIGVTGGVVGMIGAGLLVPGRQDVRFYDGQGQVAPEGDFVRLTEYNRLLELSAWGGGLLGGGLGLSAAAGLESLRASRSRLIAEFSVGGVLSAVGGVIHALLFRGYVRDKQPTTAGDLHDKSLVSHGRLGIAASATVLGLGAGLLLGVSTAHLARTFALPRLGASLHANPGALALSLQGQF